jgi:hypothetical protein
MDQLNKFKIRQFEDRYRRILIDMFKELNQQWKRYPIKHNKKIDMDYTSFVTYCYHVTDKQYDI